MNRRWTVRDRYGNLIYLTQERWEHIIDPINHPQMEAYEEHLKTTIIKGKRHQEPLHPDKYRYLHFFDDLPDQFNCIEAVVRFSFNKEGEIEGSISNNWIMTSYFESVRRR